MRTGQVRAAYLGDGVFVQFQPNHLVLTIEHTGMATQQIGLTPEAWQALVRLVRQYAAREWPLTAEP